MLPDVTLPVSLSALLAAFGPCFTVPTFRTFCALACGFLGQTGKRTVCGMLTGAGLSRTWPHDRAHSFFSRARWNPDDLGITVAQLVIGLLAGDGEPMEVLIGGTLSRRRGKKVWAASWFHDGSARRSSVRRSLTPTRLRCSGFHDHAVTPANAARRSLVNVRDLYVRRAINDCFASCARKLA